MSKVVALLLAVVGSAASAAPSFVGMWFACERATGQHEVLEVERSDGGYKALLESSRSGSIYSASLTGAVRSGVLELRGCQSYRGVQDPKCEPPVVVKLGSRGSAFARIGQNEYERKAAACAARHKKI